MGDQVRSGGTDPATAGLSSGKAKSSNGSNSSNGYNKAVNGTFSTLFPVVHEKRLRKVLESMQTQLPHSVRELAQQVNLSPTHLQRLFKQETGIHLSDIVSERRLETAAQLLITTNMEVKQIAFFVGYGHHSSFVRAFHRRFGQAPKHYRRKCA
jgi:transcriptional regulator GlxA family with amidase domain